MGKSKFPGKPSKSVMKERVRVLHKNENKKNCHASLQALKKNRNCIYNGCCNTNVVAFDGFHNLLETTSESKPDRTLLKNGIKLATQGYVCVKGHLKKISGNNIPEDEERKLRSAALGSPSYSRDSSGLNFKCLPTDFDKLIKKKTVTFKNVPETSDDKSKKSKIHNPLNKGPLISIMKKECRSSKRYVLRGDSIVRPSRLTEILKNSENIDKTNSLSFRTMQISNNLKKQKVDTPHTLSKDVCSGREFLDDEMTLFCESESQNQNNKQLEKLQDMNNCKSIDKWKLNDTYELGNDVNRLYSKRNERTIPNKTILRQPRLYIEPRNEKLPTVNHDVPTTSDTILLSPLPYMYSACGVCNSTINNEASPNQKCGMSCDACQNFVSKITKNTISSSSSPFTAFKIQCNKRSGECAIPQKNTMKSLKQINDERCSACWLNKCVNSFHLSSGHKLRLNAILSETHKIKTEGKIKSMFTVSPSIKHFRNEVSTMDCNQTSAKTTELSWSFKSTHSSDLFSGNNTDLTMDIWLQPKTCPPKVLRDDSTVGMNNKNCSTSTDSEAMNLSPLSDYPKRQKIDFRGPRVKHVCRSASIALGQQIARFSHGYEDKPNISQQNSCAEGSLLKNSLFGNIYNFSKKVSGDISELRKRLEVDDNNFQSLNNTVYASQSKSISASIDPSGNSLDQKVTEGSENNDQFQKRKQRTNDNRKAFMLTRHGLGSLAKRNLMRMTKIRSCEKKSKLISIDFWGNYIPAEVNETGFGIIFTETLPIFALCFLCGSMDLENLYFCASCCEPYHSYCIQEDNAPNKNKNSAEEKTENMLSQLNWVCPRCTICYTCNMSSGSKIKCQKCNKNYHTTCMGTSKGLLGADRPLICRSCLKCQTCSTSKVSKYVGSQPICMHCFKMSKSESRCPLCNNTFDDILDVTILKCGVCEKFIHAKCEGLTEVQSNLQSNLPESVKFACKKCSLENDYAKSLAKNWREAVVEELKCGLLDILKLLSRSRQANILKNSRSKCLCDFDPTKVTSKDYSKNNEENDIIEDEQDNVNISNPYSKYLCSSSNCNSSDVPKSPNLYDIRKKVIDKKYITLVDFNADMNDVILPVKNDELILTYKEILSEKFSWFQNETKTCTDALEEDMFESNCFFQVDDEATEDIYVSLKLPESARQVLHNLNDKKDNRPCILCQKKGDGEYLHESRLLYCGFNTWVHANCIVWSNCVYEEFDGTIQNVKHALRSGRLTKCSSCNLHGATIGCSFSKCCNYFHFICAIKAKCIFTSDKLVRCSNHSTKHITENQDSFNVSRPLYVNFDNTLRKHVEPCKVQFMLGSLAVVQLGSIYPKFSDTSEAIVPINFICTRLYWSSKEPWKIVKYNVQTSIEHFSLDNDISRHFTVDHSQSVNIVENQLSQIVSWQNSLSREELDDTLHHDLTQFGTVRASADNETYSDEYVEEEPQNNSDLLPPEIKDAIFEDLPHDILDGISMLDIFPKLMIYEDMISVDAKTEKSHNEIFDNNRVQSTGFVNHLEENNTVQSMYARRELQPSKQECFIRNADGFRSQPCSSSVTLNSKFETTRGYLSKRLSDKGYNEIQPCNAKINYFGSTSDCFRENLKKQKLKLMQLDGTDDMFLGHIYSRDKNTKNKPVICERCHCTYKTRDSFQRHLLHCEQLSKIERDTETLSKLHLDLNSTTMNLGDFIQNSIPIQSCIRGNEETRNITVLTKSSLSSKPTISQNKDVISDYHNDNGLKLYANSIDEVCEETGWESGGLVEFGVVNKSKQVNCNYNFIDMNNKNRSERFKDYSSAKPELALIPDTLNTISNKADYISPGKHNNLPFLNHHLVLNNHFTQKEEQNQQQQFVVIQQSNNQPLFVHQVSNAQSIPQNIFPVVLANNSVQYTSMQPSTNPLMQGSIFQADTSGNIIISSGLQMLSMPPLQFSAQSSPQLIGAFNQPQPLHLGQNQVFIGGTTAMDILPNSNQVILTTSPVYYGLETIVQNTVMSSQQFVSTAMQGVLSQNASFSATTTQVFQSSKFEPVNETQSNYVVLNSTDGSAVVVPQTNVLTGFVNTSTDYQSSYSHDFGNIYSAHHQTFVQEPQPTNVIPLTSSLSDMSSIVIGSPINQIHSAVNVETNSHITSSRKLTVKLSSINDLSSQNAMNSSNQNCKQESVKFDNSIMKKINSAPKENHKIMKKRKTCKEKKINSSPNNTNIFKTGVTATQINEVSVHNSINDKSQISEQKSGSNVPCLLLNANNKSANNKHYTEKRNVQHLIDTSNISKDVNEDIKSILQISNNKSPSPLYSINSSKLPPTSSSFGCNLNNVPTNIVAPTLQIQQNSNTTARPTNRVLPMQSIPKRSMEKLISNKTLKNILNKFIENPSSEVDQQNIKRKSEDINVNVQDKYAFLNVNKAKESQFYPNNENLALLVNSNKNEDNFIFKSNIDEVTDTNSLSKSLVDQNYEISVTGHNVTLTDRFFPDKEVVNINEKVLKNKYIKCLPTIDSGNNQDHLASTVPKTKIELKEMKSVAEPHLIYEIQSEDGFSYKSESIADIWETVFEAVQSARRAHGLSTLPIGPFADMCGVQMIGLKANALKYLIEQLPGTEGCTKYTPKYHKHNSVSKGIEHIHHDQEKEFENFYGAGRCEPFTKRSEYDIFSWLASKHRKQPKQIFLQPLDTELVIRRCNTNLPMAMKYRTLKETCKQNVGVFRSLIHGRGLFCTKDVEAGEMVIEYAGELIRSTLTDKRERFYDSKGIGCYMFKIDENFVVDATMRGNAARFINHSCEPNCYSRVVDILGHKHIIIFSLRRIVQGEELTYDYKFPFEDIKIPCSCGSRKCRRYLN